MIEISIIDLIALLFGQICLMYFCYLVGKRVANVELEILMARSDSLEKRMDNILNDLK